MRNIEAPACVAAALACMLANSGVALADSSSRSRIAAYRLDSTVAGRGACVRLSGLAGKWCCVWKDDPLYQEISALLLQGYALERRCVITWSTQDASGNYVIESVECGG